MLTQGISVINTGSKVSTRSGMSQAHRTMPTMASFHQGITDSICA